MESIRAELSFKGDAKKNETKLISGFCVKVGSVAVLLIGESESIQGAPHPALVVQPRSLALPQENFFVRLRTSLVGISLALFQLLHVKPLQMFSGRLSQEIRPIHFPALSGAVDGLPAETLRAIALHSPNCSVDRITGKTFSKRSAARLFIQSLVSNIRKS